ncbi:hypothetical protein ABHN84_20610 [Shewanella vesiculosa]|uniref:Uncharacterized protein n=1 Tax=Shewanella vesiculosa TaxID=518738 RepID=A0ABV0FXD4_9GAMM
MLQELVERFCVALIDELNEAEYLNPELSSFPHGSCEAISQMVALYLDSKGVEEVVFTRNRAIISGRNSVHYWVLVGSEVIIDLTAEQFDEFKGSCIRLVTDSPFHSQFEQLSFSRPNLGSLVRPGIGANNIIFYKRLLSRLGSV